MNELTEHLSMLATKAPETLARRVLTATGTGRFYDTVAGPTGDLLVGWSQAGIYAISPSFEEDSFLETYGVASIQPIRSELPSKLRNQIEKAIETGKLGAVAVDLSGLSEFQQAVLRKTAQIPVGQLRPYGWVAREIGKPGATRAVGSALNKNPVPVLIPCHRVGRSDGMVGQYAHGPEMKRELLRHEGLDPDQVDELAARGIRFVGSATTHVYCLPTCHNARRIQDQNRIEFRNAAGAVKDGYRACKACRPSVAA